MKFSKPTLRGFVLPCRSHLRGEGLDELLGHAEDLPGVLADAAALPVELAAVAVDEPHVREELLPGVVGVLLHPLGDLWQGRGTIQ